MKQKVLMFVLTLVFAASCGEDSEKENYSLTETGKLYCEKYKECVPEEWEETFSDQEKGMEYCINSLEKEINSEVEEGDMVNTYECRKGLYDYYKCLSILTCEKYLEASEYTSEDETGMCLFELKEFAKHCSAPSDEDEEFEE